MHEWMRRSRNSEDLNGPHELLDRDPTNEKDSVRRGRRTESFLLSTRVLLSFAPFLLLCGQQEAVNLVAGISIASHDLP